MTIKNGVILAQESDFDAYHIWVYHEQTDLYYPLTPTAEFPEYERSLFIRAKFHTPIGIEFKGYLVGITKIYCIALFSNDKKFMFNKNLPERCLQAFYKLVETLHFDKKIVPADIFPLKYETTIDLEGYRNVSGEFNAFEQLKDLRLLRWKES